LTYVDDGDGSLQVSVTAAIAEEESGRQAKADRSSPTFCGAPDTSMTFSPGRKLQLFLHPQKSTDNEEQRKDNLE
jgi:hypothetical protein